MDWLTTLQQAGLPATSAGVNQYGKVDATFERGLTPDEWVLFLRLTTSYDGSFSLVTDSNIIIGDGADEITLTVRGEPGALVTINTLTGITAGTINVQLDADGNGSQVFSCETSPTVIVFSHGETSVKVRAL